MEIKCNNANISIFITAYITNRHMQGNNITYDYFGMHKIITK